MGDLALIGESGKEMALDIILGLRFHFDLFANVRPVRLLPGVSSILKGCDEDRRVEYTLIRENSEGLYSSHFGGLVFRDEIAIDNQIISREGSRRISQYAFELARRSNGSPLDSKKSVTCVDKSNVLKSFAFFRKVFREVAGEFPDVEPRYMYGDAMAQYMLFHPQNLSVIVTENMIGDILSDLGAATDTIPFKQHYLHDRRCLCALLSFLIISSAVTLFLKIFTRWMQFTIQILPH